MLSRNLSLSYLQSDQAQKHVTVNESLRALDTLVHTAVDGHDLATPPTSPAEGATYLVGRYPSGIWRYRANTIAVWENNGWTYHTPREGWQVWHKRDERMMTFTGSRWFMPGENIFDSGWLTSTSVYAISSYVQNAFTITSVGQRDLLFGWTIRPVTALVPEGSTWSVSDNTGVTHNPSLHPRTGYSRHVFPRPFAAGFSIQLRTNADRFIEGAQLQYWFYLLRVAQ